MVSIVLLLAAQYFVVGVLLALWSMYTMLVQPLAKRVAYLFSAAELRGRRIQTLTAVGLSALAVAAIIVWLPAPSWTRTEGVAVAPQNAQVRAGADAFIRTVAAKPNQAVKAGDALVVTEDAELLARVKVFEAQLREQQARYAAAHEDRVQMNMIREEIAHIEERLDGARKRAAELLVRSPGDGIFVMAQVGDAPGRFVHRGELLGYVMDYSRVAVQVVVPQGEVDLVRKMTRRVELRQVERISQVLTAEVKRVVPAATSQLPNLALSAQGGGEVSLDHQTSGDSGRGAEARSATPLFIFELEMADRTKPLALGSRIYVRFEREPESLGTQWYRAVRQTLLKKFNV
jgi:putative peptide zinc metalloprotease protein